jgi:hypothetical protein
MTGAVRKRYDREDLETLLSQVLVPVEPNSGFVHNLRAKLVLVDGQRKFSGWMILVVLGTMLLILVTWIGLILRFILGWVGILNRIASRRRDGNRAGAVAN